MNYVNTRSWVRLVLLASLVVTLGTGCNAMPRRMAFQGPSLSSEGMGAEFGPAQGTPVTWVDRHPLFYKPVEWFERGGPNPVIAVGAATVVGVPAGVLGEVRQIIVGCPVRP